MVAYLALLVRTLMGSKHTVSYVLKNCANVFVLTLVVSLLTSLVVAIPLVSKQKHVMEDEYALFHEVVESVKKDLPDIHIKNGVLHITETTPYVIHDAHGPYIIIDPEMENTSLYEGDKKRAFMLVTRHQAIWGDEENARYDFSGISEYHLTAAMDEAINLLAAEFILHKANLTFVTPGLAHTFLHVNPSNIFWWMALATIAYTLFGLTLYLLLMCGVTLLWSLLLSVLCLAKKAPFMQIFTSNIMSSLPLFFWLHVAVSIQYFIYLPAAPTPTTPAVYLHLLSVLLVISTLIYHIYCICRNLSLLKPSA